MREVKKTRYFFAAILTILIFAFGLLLGFYLENVRISEMYEELKVEKIEFSDLELQDRYVNFLGKKGQCDRLYQIFYDSMSELDDKRIRLENYFDMSQVKTEEYNTLKREYTISSLNYWILSQQIKEYCDGDFGIILYFYGDDTQCPSCSDMGTHLTYIKRLLESNVLIFSLDSNLEGTVQTLKKVYDVKDYPTLIINEEKYGYMNNREILEKLCEEGNYEECGEFNQNE
ncbi:MAG: hypothetical protein ACOCP4_00155 [Candidatus Woesearchaeota archaeon]